MEQDKVFMVHVLEYIADTNIELLSANFAGGFQTVQQYTGNIRGIFQELKKIQDEELRIIYEEKDQKNK